MVCTVSGICEFKLKTDSAGLLEDKKICKMIIDERCVMCENGEGEDVEQLLVTLGEFVRDSWIIVDEMSRIIGAGE